MRFRFFNKEYDIRIDKFLFLRKDKGLLFIHPPKNGGTSITNTVRLKFRSSFILNNKCSIEVTNSNLNKKLKLNYNEVRMLILNYVINKKYRFISGHFSYYDGILNDCKNYYIITVLRNPIDAFISKYFFTEQKLPLADFLETQIAHDWGMDLVTRFSCPNKKYKNLDDQIKESQNNLEKLDFVGDLENISEFNSWFLSKFKRKIKVKKVNVGLKKKQISDENLSKIKDIVKPSTLVYNKIFPKK